jgi:hypothetical protein
MKKKLSTLFLYLVATIAIGQTNLVPNPSFEMPLNCPSGGGLQVSDCTDWINYGNTPDYHNSCYGTVPNNMFGYQFPRTGSGMMGMLIWYGNYTANYREYIATQLTSPLVVGQKYYISYYINYAAWYSPWEHVAANKLGLRFTKVTSSSSASLWTTNFSHLKTDSIYKDTVNWLRVSGSFIADSAYTHVVMGNFYDDAHTDTSLIPGSSAGPKPSYYYIDDICVSTNSLTCSSTAGISYDKPQIGFKIFPNPTNHNATLSFDNAKKEICTLILYDNKGVVVQFANNIITDKVEIKRDNLQIGLYFYLLQTANRVIATGKLVIE